MDTPKDQPETPASRPEVALSPHQAKRQFRLLLTLFAGYWQAAAQEAAEGSAWQEYFSLLRACQRVLDRAPMHPAEAKSANIQRHYEQALEQLVTMLNSVSPGGLSELEGYIVDETVREHRRQQGLTRYRRIKAQRRKRR